MCHFKYYIRRESDIFTLVIFVPLLIKQKVSSQALSSFVASLRIVNRHAIGDSTMKYLKYFVGWNTLIIFMVYALQWHIYTILHVMLNVFNS